MSSSILVEITKQLEKLPEDLQKEVLKFVRSLKKREMKGVSGKLVAQFAGCITLEDLERMKSEIENSCEQVEKSEW